MAAAAAEAAVGNLLSLSSRPKQYLRGVAVMPSQPL